MLPVKQFGLSSIPSGSGPDDKLAPRRRSEEFHEGGQMTKVHTDRIDQGFVLGNQVLVAEVFAKNGFLVLSSVTGEDKTADANADQISQGKEDADSRQIEHPLLGSLT